MKKALIICLALASLTQAKTFDSVEFQIEGWNADSSGTFQRQGSVIDLDERGLKRKFAPSIVLDLKGASDYLNFKFGYTKIKNEGKKVLSSDMQLNGLNFDKGELQKSKLDLKIYDAIYYIDKPQKNLADFQYGLGLRYFDGSFLSQTCSRETKASFHKLIGVGYLRAEIPIPKWEKSAKWINQVIISPVDDFYVDMRTAIKINVSKNISLETGYRYSSFETSGKYNANIKSDGLYGAISYKFKF